MPRPTRASSTDSHPLPNFPQVPLPELLRSRRLFLAWGILVTILSLLPGKTLSRVDIWDWTGVDKIAHFTVYLVWSVLLLSAYPGAPRRRFLGLASVVGYGVLLEFLQQAFYRDRFLEVSDIAANTAGVLAGVLLHKGIFEKNH